MCSRYTLNVINREGLPLPEEFDRPLFNIAPTAYVPVLVLDRDQVKPEYMSWGYRPEWAKSRIINSRAETVLEKPTFRGSFKDRRILVPATGFFEWKEEDGKKQPFYFQRADGRMFAIGAFWGADHETAEREFVLLTTQANRLVYDVHDRMPAMFDLDIAQAFLMADPEDAQAMAVLSFRSDEMISHRVTRKMNWPGYQSQDAVAPID
ncbi:MAG: SOS response-associated peptidase [Armatimonadetes bacterium]|nr:SOS response-associated peptidase [Armatimonadota bacterium]